MVDEEDEEEDEDEEDEDEEVECNCATSRRESTASAVRACFSLFAARKINAADKDVQIWPSEDVREKLDFG